MQSTDFLDDLRRGWADFFANHSLQGTLRLSAAHPLNSNVGDHDKMPSAGFLVIAFAAAILVMLPSAFVFALGWRSGLWGRVFSVFALQLIIVLGWVTFTDTELPDLESRALLFFVIWGASIHFGVGVYFCAKVASKFFKRRHP